jgi:lysophospholipid acyltransferase (LPLAT)-like uncharacterized protein
MNRFILAFLAYLLRAIVTLLYWTLRVEVQGDENITKQHPCIIALWHNQLLLLAPILYKIILRKKLPLAVLISKSRDGDIPSRFAETYKRVEVIRVGHKGRHSAMLEALEALKENKIIVLTPDGPRGPIYKAKPGVIYAAQKSKAPVIPMRWEASRCIRLKSWDRFCIPLPFSKVTCIFGKPIFSTENEPVEMAQRLLEQAL